MRLGQHETEAYSCQEILAKVLDILSCKQIGTTSTTSILMVNGI